MKKILLFLLSIGCFAQTQIGSTINGMTGEGLGFNSDLSLNGDRVVIGCRSGNNKVKVYENIANIWTQVGNSITTISANDGTGYSVSISNDGTIIAVGSPYNFGGTNSPGKVRIFHNTSGVWTQLGSTITGDDENDQFGIKVALSSDGSVVAIGARYKQNQSPNGSGYAKVYKNVSGVWTQIGTTINGEANEDNFGCALALSSDGSIVAIGAPNNDSNGTDSGYTRVFQNVSGIWMQIGNNLIGEAAGDYSATNIALSSDGNILAIGAMGNDENGGGSGHVRIYKNVSGLWTQLGSDINGQAAGDSSGAFVDLSSDGTIIAIGSPGYDGANPNSDKGQVRIFKFTSGTWTQIGNDINGISTLEGSGRLSLSSDGKVVASGSTGNLSSSNGTVRLYSLSALSTNEFITLTFTLYPIPTSSILNINLHDNVLFNKAIIYNILGQIVKTDKTTSINTSDLPSGTFFIEVFTNKGKATKSFIKE